MRPRLKKLSLLEDLNNYRSISNLNFISKILEKVVTSHCQPTLFLPFQSAYRSFHSTESTLLKVHNDIISSIDNGEVNAFILHDFSAAFDTVECRPFDNVNHSKLSTIQFCYPDSKTGLILKIPACRGFLSISANSRRS